MGQVKCLKGICDYMIGGGEELYNFQIIGQTTTWIIDLVHNPTIGSNLSKIYLATETLFLKGVHPQ